jgi:inhibitor of cysteine peptidase
MVQKEVMRKTKTYGLIGLLLAVMLVAMIYSYGVTPGISPNQPLPQISPTTKPDSSNPSSTNYPNNSPNTLPTTSNYQNEVSPMKTFSSISELTAFLNSTNPSGYYSLGLTDIANTAGAIPAAVPAPTTASVTSTQSTGAKDFSTTNIQVAGVDEADTVKTDGKYLYVIGNNSQIVYIIDANPINSKVLSKIFLNNTSVSGIYLSADGKKLAVLGNEYISYGDYNKIQAISPGLAIYPYMSGNTFAYIYDVSNKATPILSKNFTMTGNYVNSRMIGNYVYDILSENAYLINGSVVVPTAFVGSETYSVPANRIYYANTSDTYYTYTTIAGIDILSDSAQVTNMTIMMGTAGTIYVSQTNIYVTYPIRTYQTVTTTPQPIDTAQNGAITIIPMPIIWQPTWQGTAVYRIHISESSLTFAAKGNVTGSILSQYSMDENKGYFRIATTSYEYNSNSWTGIQQNNLYVLDANLNLVGKIENLASGENLHAARFMGDRCYLITFQQVDPLFVLDLSQPANPKVLGNLTIPGYSDFLQPYDATHLIGIGQDVNASIDADKVHTPGAVYYTAILGLKVSLFDVSDVTNPKEISKYVIGDRGTTSEALNNPKALLFDLTRNLLVLPVDLYLVDTKSSMPSNTPGIDISIAPPIASSDTAFGQFAWQGVYIFNVDLMHGLTLKGNVTQMDNAAALLTNPSLAAISSYQWINYDQFVTRSLYIGNTLYTFSQARVQLNSLDNFALIAKVDLN